MTAEIGMLNKYAVALAADSAVTVRSGDGKSKVYNSANKLFKLSHYEPIGIMIYGDASFMGVPWETIIKLYNKKLAKTSFRLVEDYANDFLDYVIKFNIPENDINKHIRQMMQILIEFFGEEITETKENLETWVKRKLLEADGNNATFNISINCEKYIRNLLKDECISFFFN